MTAKDFEYWTTFSKNGKNQFERQKSVGHDRFEMFITLPLFLVIRASGEKCMMKL